MKTARCTRSGRRISNGGFTLVEVMVALVILAVGALTMTQLAVSVAVLMQQSGLKTELLNATENRLENVVSRPYSEITPGIELDTLTLQGVSYVRRVTIAAPSARTREVRVDLSITGGERTAYSAMTWVSAP